VEGRRVEPRQLPRIHRTPPRNGERNIHPNARGSRWGGGGSIPLDWTGGDGGGIDPARGSEGSRGLACCSRWGRRRGGEGPRDLCLGSFGERGGGARLWTDDGGGGDGGVAIALTTGEVTDRSHVQNAW
jgi:hypothetical protein